MENQQRERVVVVKGALETRYENVRKRLDNAGYLHEVFSADSLPIVERLFNDLEKATENQQKYAQQYHYFKKIATELEAGVAPFKQENTKLIKENSVLRMEVLRSKEHIQDISRESHGKLRELESDNQDLKLLINQFLNRVKKLEIENLEKAKKIGELEGNKTVMYSSGDIKNRETILEMEINCTPNLICPHCTRIRNYVEFGKGRDPQASDYIKIADSRIDALQIQIRKMKANQKDLMELLASMKTKVEDRDAEIEKLRGIVKVGPGFGNEVNGNININRPNYYSDKDLAMALKAAEMQLQILQRRNMNLEKKLKSSILQEHENFMLGNNVSAAERELVNTFMDTNVDKYPFETLTMQEKINLLEIQLSHCCQEKAKLKLLVQECELNHRRANVRPTPTCSPPRKSKFNQLELDGEIVRPGVLHRKSASLGPANMNTKGLTKTGKQGLRSSVSDQHVKSVSRPTLLLKQPRGIPSNRSSLSLGSKISSKVYSTKSSFGERNNINSGSKIKSKGYTGKTSHIDRRDFSTGSKSSMTSGSKSYSDRRHKKHYTADHRGISKVSRKDGTLRERQSQSEDETEEEDSQLSTFSSEDDQENRQANSDRIPVHSKRSYKYSQSSDSHIRRAKQSSGVEYASDDDLDYVENDEEDLDLESRSKRKIPATHKDPKRKIDVENEGLDKKSRGRVTGNDTNANIRDRYGRNTKFDSKSQSPSKKSSMSKVSKISKEDLGTHGRSKTTKSTDASKKGQRIQRGSQSSDKETYRRSHSREDIEEDENEDSGEEEENEEDEGEYSEEESEGEYDEGDQDKYNEENDEEYSQGEEDDEYFGQSQPDKKLDNKSQRSRSSGGKSHSQRSSTFPNVGTSQQSSTFPSGGKSQSSSASVKNSLRNYDKNQASVGQDQSKHNIPAGSTWQKLNSHRAGLQKTPVLPPPRKASVKFNKNTDNVKKASGAGTHYEDEDENDEAKDNLTSKGIKQDRDNRNLNTESKSQPKVHSEKSSAMNRKTKNSNIGRDEYKSAEGLDNVDAQARKQNRDRGILSTNKSSKIEPKVQGKSALADRKKKNDDNLRRTSEFTRELPRSTKPKDRKSNTEDLVDDEDEVVGKFDKDGKPASSKVLKKDGDRRNINVTSKLGTKGGTKSGTAKPSRGDPKQKNISDEKRSSDVTKKTGRPTAVTERNVNSDDESLSEDVDEDDRVHLSSATSEEKLESRHGTVKGAPIQQRRSFEESHPSEGSHGTVKGAPMQQKRSFEESRPSEGRHGTVKGAPMQQKRSFEESHPSEGRHGTAKGAPMQQKRSFEESLPSEVFVGKVKTNKGQRDPSDDAENSEEEEAHYLTDKSDRKMTKNPDTRKDKQSKRDNQESDLFKDPDGNNGHTRGRGDKPKYYEDDQDESFTKPGRSQGIKSGMDSGNFGVRPVKSTPVEMETDNVYKQTHSERQLSSREMYRRSRSGENIEEEEEEFRPLSRGMLSPATSPPLSTATRNSSQRRIHDQYQALIAQDELKLNSALDNNSWQKRDKKGRSGFQESYENGEYSRSHSVERRRGASSDEENANFFERNQKNPVADQGRGRSLFRDPYEMSAGGSVPSRLAESRRILSSDRNSNNSNSIEDERNVAGSQGYDPFRLPQRFDSQNLRRDKDTSAPGPSHRRDDHAQDLDTSDSTRPYDIQTEFLQKDNERLKTQLHRKENEMDRLSTEFEILQRRVKNLQTEVDSKREALPLAAQSTIRRLEEERKQMEGLIRQHQMKQSENDRKLARNEEKATSELRALQNQLREIERIHNECKVEKKQAATLKLNFESEIRKLRRDLNEAQADGQQWRMDAQKAKLSVEQTERLLSEVQKRASGSSHYVPQRENQEMAQQIRQYAAREKDLERELANIRASLKSLDRDKDEMRVELDHKDEKLASILHDCTEHMDEIARLQLKLKNCELQLGHTGETSREHDREMQVFRRQVESLRKDLEHATKERDEALKELRRVSGSKTKGDADRRSMESELERVTKESGELKKQLQKYIDEVRRIEDLLLQKDEEMNALMEHYRALTIENSNLESHRTSLEREMTTNREGVREAMDQNYTLKSQITSQAALIKSYEEEIERLTQGLTSAENKRDRLMAEEKSLQADIKAARDLIHRLETTMDKYKLETANMESMKNKIEAECKDLQAYNDVLEAELSRERTGHEDLEKVLASTREEDFKAKNRERDLAAERDQLAERINLQQSRTEAMIEELSRYRMKATELQSELERVRRQYQIEKSEKDSALSDLKRLQENLNSSSMSNLLASALGGGSSSISPSQFGSSARGIPQTNTGFSPRDASLPVPPPATGPISTGPRSYTIESHQDQVLTPRSDSDLDLPLEASTSRNGGDSEDIQSRNAERRIPRSGSDDFGEFNF